MQDLILSVILPIEKRIATNTAINENLEQQVQAIFKSWFVDFEPFGGVMPENWKIGMIKTSKSKENFVMPDRGWANYCGIICMKKINGIMDMPIFPFDPFLQKIVRMSSPQDYAVFPLSSQLALLTVKIMWVLIIVAVLLGVVILYNLTNINVSERIRELSTIKVLGFFDKEVTLYIYRETIILTLIGILTGFLTGDWLYKYIITVVPPDEAMFNPALSLRAFAVPFVLISLITLLLGFVINRRLKNVNA